MNEQPRPKVGVGIIIFREIDGKPHIMMHQRKTRELGEGYWGTGGGHLELGESLEAAALRELREEAGPDVQVKNVRFLGVSNIVEFAPKHYVDVSFVADWASGEPQNAQPEEVDDWQWVPLDTLPSPLFPPVARYLDSLSSGKQLHDAQFE